MFLWQGLSQILQHTAGSIVRLIKDRRREGAAFGLAGILFALGYSFPGLLSPELRAWVESWRYSGLVVIPGLLYAGGIGFFFFGLYRIWQVAHAPDFPLPKNRPSAIKGPVAFTPSDGELFRKLGREDELSKLLGFIEDDQMRMVVLMGASGAGKTSLLRAGLTDVLKGKDIDYHYWEAVPTSPGQRLLRAIQESWQTGAASNDDSAGNAASFSKPKSLDDLINPSPTLGNRRHVIILDQFEQLHGSRANMPVFRLLRKIAREAKPPHRMTWIIAFRREFRAEWEDFTLPEKERGIYPAEISLRPFTAEQARDVISQLISEAGLSVQQKVVDNLVEATTVVGEVSPVDIGIGLLVLAELHDRQSGQTVTLGDYHFAGGAEGLLTQYISRCLDNFPETDREIILKAMLALRDPVTNQRIAEGRTCPELAREVQADTGRLKIQLDRLFQRDMRLLEVVAPDDESSRRYRIPHERLISSLNRMAGQLLAYVDQAKLKFENAYSAWTGSGKSAQYLLKSKDLRLVERYETQIPWGTDELEKRAFLRRSQRRRRLVHLGRGALVLCLAAISWMTVQQYQRYDAQAVLKDNSYPPELYEWQDQLKVLKISDPISMQRLPWLRSDTLESLEITAARSTHLLDGLADSLTRCRALKTLHLNIRDSEVNDLTPLTELTNLTYLEITGDKVRNLKPLEKLTGLTHLSLNFSQGTLKDLAPLEKLTGLTHLDLAIYEEEDLTSLTKLTSLTNLKLTLTHSEVSDLTPLTKLTGLTHLNLDLISSKVSDLTPLMKLTNLTNLDIRLTTDKVYYLEPLTTLHAGIEVHLHLVGYEIPEITLLANLIGLTHLDLDMGLGQGGDLTPLTKLTRLTHLGIQATFSEVINFEALAGMTGLTHLKLTASAVQRPNLAFLEKLIHLTSLEFDLTGAGALVGAEIYDLTPLMKLTGLTHLSLNLTGSRVRDLTPLDKLIRLTNLDLNLQFSHADDLSPLTKLMDLTNLNLALTGSRVRDLTPLTKLTRLTNLNLNLSGGQVLDLTQLPKLNSCHTLALHLNADQRVSLKAIPPTVTHLEL